MEYTDIEFLSGDIGFSRGSGWFSRGIRFFTSWHTKKAWANHAFAFVGWDLIVEAIAKITITRKKSYTGRDIKVYRLPLSDEERANYKYGMLRRFNSSIGSYGWFKLPLFALDAVCTKAFSLLGRKDPVFFFTKYMGISNIPVCSQLVVFGLYKLTDYKLYNIYGDLVPWKVISPDFLEDLLKLEVNKAELIYEIKTMD